jgi:NAD(P)H-dependent FMN reductase
MTDITAAPSNHVRDAERPRLMLIVASTRPGRVGWPVAEWVRERVESHGGFELDVADLAEIALPFMDEPNHPRLRQYTHAHTKAWSRRVAAADAFVFVMPEYNHGFNAPLKNAIDYLVHEWAYKPVGLVSYGGIAGGTRAVQLLKPVLVGLKLVALPEAVYIPFVQRFVDEAGQFQATEELDEAAGLMLTELERWIAALRPLRMEAATRG